MALEIERKFLVSRVPDSLPSCRVEQIEQGYLAIEADEVEVRLRRRGDGTYLAVKRGSGQERNEVEVEVSAEQFQALWPLTAGRRLRKARYYVPTEAGEIELDVYLGALEGLITAEIEFSPGQSPESFEPLDWLGEELTGHPGYANKALATRGVPAYDPAMVREDLLEQTETGIVPTGEGWFVLNAREARWLHGEGRGALLSFEGETEFPQVGINIFVLPPGEPTGMYHWEADQEDFLVLFGEALLIIEGDERPLKQWDFVHCPVGTNHMIVGAGAGPCGILAIGAREHQAGAGWGGYTVDEAALRHGAGVDQETTEPDEAYARFPERKATRYREDWLPGES